MSETTLTNDQLGDSAWRRFWNRGGWWKALLIVVIYFAVFQGVSWLVTTVFAGLIDTENLFGSASTVFFALALPILIMGLLTLVFVSTLGWRREILGRQPIKGRGWMWIAVVLVLVPVVVRLLATKWSAYSIAVVLAVLFLGLCVGLAEELITRGVAVNLLRRGGYSERIVFVLSSLLFALLHSGNILSGQAVATVALTVVYTFGFGAMMYLSMRATGSVIWAILLHAATDPTIFLATGGIDSHGNTSGDTGLLLVAAVFNYLYFLFAIIAIFLVKGRVYARTRPAKDESVQA